MAQSASMQAKVTGGLLIGGAAATLFLMLHHPTLGSAGFHSLAEEAQSESGLNGAVHGCMIGIMLLYTFGAALAGRVLGVDRWQARAGNILIPLGALMMIQAALVSGFLIPDLAQGAHSGEASHSFGVLVGFAHAMNQVFANTGTVAFGAGILALSLGLIGRPGIARIVGAAGILIGAVMCLGMMMGHLRLDVRGMTMVAAGMGLWFAGLGAVLAMNPAGQAHSG